MSIMMVQVDVMCCQSVGTDLSMMDIDDLMTEICHLKKEVKLLETKLRQRDEPKDVSWASFGKQSLQFPVSNEDQKTSEMLLDCDMEVKTQIKEEQTDEKHFLFSDLMKVKKESSEPNDMEEKTDCEQNFSPNSTPISMYNESSTCPQQFVSNVEQKTSEKLMDSDMELKTQIKEEQTDEDDIIDSDLMKVKNESSEPNDMEEKTDCLLTGEESVDSLNNEQNFSPNSTPISMYNGSSTCPQQVVSNEEQKTSEKLLDSDNELTTQRKEQTDEDDIIDSDKTTVEEERSEPKEMEETPHHLIAGEESPSRLNSEQNLSKKKKKRSRAKNNKSLTCPQCGKRFSGKSNLSKHIKVHSGERPHRCDQCGKAFSRIYHVTRHMKTHTGERPFKCNQCKKTFIRIYHLKRHMKTHNGEKSYKCEPCGRAFTRKDHFTEHMRFHSGEKPYICELCGMTFHCQFPLKAHMKRHTDEGSYHCSSCGQSFKKSGCLETHMKYCEGRHFSST